MVDATWANVSFHARMAPHLFGYDLKLRRFPYLEDGPRSITPFILAVECVLASERVPELFNYHAALAEAVLTMLLTSPAESWQTIQGSRAVAQDQLLGHALDSEESWDPELGIGPEEIVAGCVLASFISQREEAQFISLRAFNWAKGWCQVCNRSCDEYNEPDDSIFARQIPLSSKPLDSCRLFGALAKPTWRVYGSCHISLRLKSSYNIAWQTPSSLPTPRDGVEY